MALEFDMPAAAARKGAKQAPVPLMQRKFSFGKRKVAAKDRMFFTEQLALLLETGTSLHPALQSIRSQMDDSPMAEVIEEIADGVVGGGSLSEQLAKHPEVFSPTYVNLVGASEQGGFLHEVLEQLQKMDDQNAELRASLISAFSYPAFLVCFSIFTLVFILLVVFPKFADMFANIGDRLPASTKVLMATSDFMIAHWLELLIATGAGVITLVWWLGTAAGKAWLARSKLATPFLGRVWRRVYLVVSFRVLGLSLKNGVSLVDAVRTSQEVIDNAYIRNYFIGLSETIENGGRLNDGIDRADWLPDLAKQMVATAEQSGSLPMVLLRVSDYYHKELERLLQRFSKMVEPIMLVVMGALVGLLVSSLLLPIFKLSQAVG